MPGNSTGGTTGMNGGEDTGGSIDHCALPIAIGIIMIGIAGIATGTTAKILPEWVCLNTGAAVWKVVALFFIRYI